MLSVEVENCQSSGRGFENSTSWWLFSPDRRVTLQGLEAAHHPKLAVQRGGLDTRRSDVVWQDRERDRRRSGGGLV